MMKRIAWLTDIHMDFLSEPERSAFSDNLAALSPDAILLGGDISTARDLTVQLSRLHDATSATIHFVLGNHDYYHGSIGQLRREIVEYCRTRPRLRYLTSLDMESLSPHVGLVGHDGWGDAREGNFAGSSVRLQDDALIAELIGLGSADRRRLLEALGDEAADHVRRVLPVACDRYRDVILLTHVPPFRQAAWHEGRLSDDDWAPFFTCAAMGQAILEVMSQRPDCRLTVLCGHTHSAGTTQPLTNVQVLTGAAEYGHPAIQRIFEFD